MAMHGAAKIEANWRLLFDIALACGESVTTLKLTYPGFINFLHAAELFGVKTGVYPVLIDKLWAHHVMGLTPSSSQGDLFDDSITGLDHPLLSRRRASYDIKRGDVMKLGVCGFEGFTDMMNVVCVRCYQCRKCIDLYTKDQESLSQAILLSAEDVTTLTESVKYTSQKYLKTFVSRNVLRRNSRLQLNPMINEWTQFTNVVVTHIIGSLLDSVVLPLFTRYSKRGLMYERHFYRLVDELFHTFSPAQKAAGRSIFTCCDSFFDVRSLTKSSRISNTVNDLADAPSLSCESFVEALLMLGIVLFSDEGLYPHHRSLTAKAWFVFETVYCRAAGRVAMAEEIIYTNEPKSIKPVITFAYPHYVPIEQVSSFLIGGLNLNPFEPIKVEDIGSGNPLAPLVAGRLIQPVEEAKEESVHEEKNSAEDSLLFSADISPKLAPSPMENNEGKPETPDAAPQGEHPTTAADTVEDGDAVEEEEVKSALEAPTVTAIGATAVAGVAMKLGNKDFEAVTFSDFDSPIYGTRVCLVYVNEVRAPTISHGNNYVEVFIPLVFTKLQNFRMSVRLEENVVISGKMLEQEAVITRFVFLPVQRVTVSLRDKTGTLTYSATDVLLHTTPVFQVIPAGQLAVLREVFDEGVERDAMSGEDRLPRKKFVTCCKKLGLVTPATAGVLCQRAAQSYFTMCHECNRSTLGLDNNSIHLEDVNQPESFNFHQYMCIIAQLCIHQAGTTTDVPNVVNFVSASMGKKELAEAELSVAQGSQTAIAEKKETAAASTPRVPLDINLPTIPYNALIEVPYENAMKKKSRNVALSSEIAESFLTNISIAGTQKLALTDGVRELPPFPSCVQVEPEVSQYEGDRMEGLAKDIHQVSLQIQEEFMLDEIVIKTEKK